MKTAIYITKNKVWAEDLVFDWDGVNLNEVFGKIKKELRTDRVRIVLGNDISFVTAVRADNTFLTRETVLKMVESWMPFQVDNDCFDWKQVILGHDETWIQVVAIEKDLLLSLSSAIKRVGLRVDLVTTIGVLLGEKTKGMEVPMVIKWRGKEQLTVLAVNGLVDLVISDIKEDDLMIYAKKKWNLAVNPEEMLIAGDDFDLSDRAFSEKAEGEDKLILNLPILRDMAEHTGQGSEIELGSEESVKKPGSGWWIYLVVALVILGAAGFMVYKTGIWKPGVAKIVQNTPTETPTPTAEVTPEPTKVDLSGFKVQVLNGGGITGEAAKVKKVLLDEGFVSVDTGNATATTEGTIKSKVSVPASVVEEVADSMRDYKMGASTALEADDKYDLILIIGSGKKI